MTETRDSALETVLRHDRWVVVCGLLAVAGAAWVWIVLGAGMGMDAIQMTRMAVAENRGFAGAMAAMAMETMRPATWDPGYALLMLAMWWAMMVAMMLPSAAPMLLLYARVMRKEQAAGRPYVPTGVFAAGYLAAWGGFSLVATALQWGLERLNLISDMMATTNLWLAAGILVAAGLWQLTPLKQVCLKHCRTPLSFLLHAWRPGLRGGFLMGLRHGAYCLGCCWFLMGLLFFGGVMNLYWIAGLALFVLLEKVLPLGHWLGRLAGVGLTAWGAWLAATAL
jgi:predicted metal-binding membrane protein